MTQKTTAKKRKATRKAAPKRKAKSTMDFGPTGESIASFLARQPDALRADCRVLVRMMRAVTGAPPKIYGPSMVGFGRYHYRYASGREGDCFLVGFAPRKGGLVVYLMCGLRGQEALLRALGPHTHSVACLYLKRLADIDLKVLEKLVRSSVREIKRRYPDKKKA